MEALPLFFSENEKERLLSSLIPLHPFFFFPFILHKRIYLSISLPMSFIRLQPTVQHSTLAYIPLIQTLEQSCACLPFIPSSLLKENSLILKARNGKEERRERRRDQWLLRHRQCYHVLFFSSFLSSRRANIKKKERSRERQRKNHNKRLKKKKKKKQDRRKKRGKVNGCGGPLLPLARGTKKRGTDAYKRRKKLLHLLLMNRREIRQIDREKELRGENILDKTKKPRERRI